MNRNLNLKKIVSVTILIFSTYFSFVLSNLFYLSSKGPDINFYKPYFEYFFGTLDNTGIEQGLLYYFLNAFFLSINSKILNLTNEPEILSLGIQYTNFSIYIVGLIGLGLFLYQKKIKITNVMIILSLINFFPVMFGIRLLFKPEILIFTTLVWVLFFLEMYIKNNKSYLLIFTIPPLVIIFTAKANSALMVALFLIFYFLNNIYKINKRIFFISLIIFFGLFILVSFENYEANNFLIFQHQSPEEFTGKANLDYLYRIDINSIMEEPFRQSQRNSYVGALLLDTFDDYFGNFWTDDSSLFYKDRINFLNIKLRPYLGLFYSFLFYFFVIRLIIKEKDKKYFILPFFGIIVQMGLSQFTQFNPENGDVAKAYYFSFFLVVTFALLFAKLFSKYQFRSYFLSFLFLFSIIFILGFPKSQNNQRIEYLEFNNEINIFCSLNNYFFNIDSDCLDAEEQFCFFNFQEIKKIEIKNSEYVYRNYFNQDSKNLFKNQSSYEITNLNQCLDFISDGYEPKQTLNIVRLPVVNLITLFSFLVSIVYSIFNIKKLNQIDFTNEID
tara:strand:- start:3636 stop:5303 length:1668 start_codon:yes stop_codon:yes gene_type:complete